jgi:hypothetical protein
MKKNLLFLFVLIGFQIQAQQILNISSIPANPTAADDVYILVDCQFNSGGCNVWQQSHSFFSAFTINAGAMHCLGPLAMMCNYTDSFHLGPLAAGNYTFNFQLNNGYGGPPCTPGIVPGPTDSYNFTVSLPTSEKEIEREEFNIYPNPASEELKIENGEFKIDAVEIYNTLGEKILNQKPTDNKQQQPFIDISKLSPGMYVIELKSGEKFSRKIFSVQR